MNDLMNAIVGGPGLPVVMGEVMGDKLITRPGRLKISCTAEQGEGSWEFVPFLGLPY